jgi:glycosyltransferase involved in cell wall biosynthesis
VTPEVQGSPVSPPDIDGSHPRVLYMAYWGALEPLGQSLVVPALERMDARGVALSLVTFEKPADLRSESLVRATQGRLRGIPWVSLRYHKKPRIPATLFDVANGWRTGVLLGRRCKAQLVHGRTFVGGLIGRVVATTLGVPFLYHNEGFYPDEMVDGGFWAEGSPMHRVTRNLERRLYEGADGLIVLSSRAARRVENLPTVSRRGTPVIVVPSCVDLQRFVPGAASSRPGPLRLVYSGAIGGRYELGRIGRFVAILAERTPVRLAVLTREPRAVVAGMLAAGGLPGSLWESRFIPHLEMPARLASEDAGLIFLARGISEFGCSPTKIGEYWACGLPIITTPGVSDTDELIERFRCGVIVPEHTDEAYRRAGADLHSLLADPDLHVRCRAAAEAHYALEPACDRQVQLYREVSIRQA